MTGSCSSSSCVCAAPLQTMVVTYANGCVPFLPHSLEQTFQIHMVTHYRFLFSVERDEATSNLKVLKVARDIKRFL